MTVCRCGTASFGVKFWKTTSSPITDPTATTSDAFQVLVAPKHVTAWTANSSHCEASHISSCPTLSATVLCKQSKISVNWVITLHSPIHNQSINHTSTAPISPAKPGSLAVTAESVFNSNIDANSSVTSKGHGEWRYLWGKGQVKELFLLIFHKGSNWYGWTYRQLQVVPKRRGTRVKSSCTSIGLDPRDWQTIIVVWSQWKGWKWCGKNGMKINRLFFTQGFVGQQIYLKQYSKRYWQPMKGTKQRKAASKWRRLCHQAGQSILNTLKPYEVNVADTIQKWIAIIKTTRHESCCK